MRETRRQSEAVGRRAERGARCLMLVPRGFDAPSELLEGLERRGIALEEVSDAPSVMVALAGGQRYLSVVIVEPQAVLELEQLLEAVGRYHGAVPVWQYVVEGKPRLSRLRRGCVGSDNGVVADGGEQRAKKAEAREEPDDSGRELGEFPRIAGRIHPWRPQRRGERSRPMDEDVQPSGPQGPAAEADDAGSEAAEDFEQPQIRVTLSEEELAMLLGDGDGEPADRGSADDEERRR